MTRRTFTEAAQEFGLSQVRLTPAEAVFLAALDELRSRYREHIFWVERDLVHWLQHEIRSTLPAGYRVFNDYGMLPGPRRARSADLAIVDDSGVLLAAEFKFEPASSRTDIMANKLPVIGWADVLKDIDRIEEFVTARVTPVAWAICIDEGGRYRLRSRPSRCNVVEWASDYSTQVTATRWPPPPHPRAETRKVS
jgi:hypothetical protein